MKPLFIALLLLISGCANGIGPYNATNDGGDSNLMLKGHDPVAYFSIGKHTIGRSEFKVVHQGATYRFASAENKSAFEKLPEKFVPQYGGYCANGIAYGIPWGGDPDAWQIIAGKLYIFGGAASRNYFTMDQANNRKLADQYWASEVKGSTALVQRYWRLLWRVPHYKTGGQLEAEWQQKKSPAVGEPAPPNLPLAK